MSVHLESDCSASVAADTFGIVIDITKSNELYVILYNDDKVNNSIPVVRDANTGFKLYIPNRVIRLLDTRLRNAFVVSKDDFNINVKFVEERNGFCIIYHIDIE